jgi:hypothetical protein
MFPTPVTICLQIREVHRNCNEHVSTHIQEEAKKMEITIELSQILRELLIAPHMT